MTLLLARLGLVTLLVRPILAGAFLLQPNAPVPDNYLLKPVPGHKTWPYPPWPNGLIPYQLQALPHWLSVRSRNAMRDWERQTCVRFVPKGNATTWAEFTKKDKSCFAGRRGYPGPNFGAISVNLEAPNTGRLVVTFGWTWRVCGLHGMPGQLIGHVIGLVREQQRSDAAKYVRVDWNASYPNDETWYNTWPNTDNTEPYDYKSIMHTHRHWTSKGDAATLVSITKEQIDPSTRPTIHDYNAVNRFYKCPKSKTLAVPVCIEGPVPTNADFSSYTFRLDEQTVTWMRANGHDRVAVEQICNQGRPTNAHTTNLGYAELGSGQGGPDRPYTVKDVPRCKKDRSRRIGAYQIHLCKGRGNCPIACRGTEHGRRLCPTKNGKRIDSKAITVDDPVLWVCHPL